MSPNVHPRRPAARGQRGLSLITTLVFMIAALVLGISVLSVGAMQERIVGNTKDRDIAFQSAEAALRDAEADIAANINATTVFTDSCNLGLCTPPSQRAIPSPLPVDKQPGFDWTVASTIRNYGQYTGARAVPGVWEPPTYVIEKLGDLGTPPGESVVLGIDAPAPGTAYRISVRAAGVRAETVVFLQSTFATR